MTQTTQTSTRFTSRCWIHAQPPQPAVYSQADHAPRHHCSPSSQQQRGCRACAVRLVCMQQIFSRTGCSPVAASFMFSSPVCPQVKAHRCWSVTRSSSAPMTVNMTPSCPIRASEQVCRLLSAVFSSQVLISGCLWLLRMTLMTTCRTRWAWPLSQSEFCL